MPTFINHNATPARVKGPDGDLVRILAGQVVEADGAYADALEATSGFDTASSAEVKAYAKTVEDRKDDPTPSERLKAKLSLSPLRTLVRLAVAAPNRRVIGDSAAPHGPDSGTVTTKGEVAKTSVANREAFAQNERLPGENPEGVEIPPAIGAFDLTSAEIEAKQGEAAEQAEELAKVFNGADDGADLFADAAGKAAESGDLGSTGPDGDAGREAAAEDNGKVKPPEGDSGQQDGPTEPTEPTEPTGPSKTQLRKESKLDLDARAKSEGVDGSGNKDELVARLADHFAK